MVAARREPRRRFAAVAAALVMLTLTADRAPDEVRGHVMTDPGPTEGLRSLFISGHSLTGQSFAENLAAIAGAGGAPIDWHLQYRAGSSLRDRAGGAMQDVAAYDAVLLAERTPLLEGVMLDDTIGQLTALSKRAKTVNPTTRTYLFAGWLNVDRFHDPRRWIAYERLAGPAWRCVAQVAEGRGAGAVTVVPAGEALAALVEGIVTGRVAVPLQALFTDDVHLTAAGTYYTALVTHEVLHGHLPDELPVPPGVSADIAAELQAAARNFLTRPDSRAPADCRAYIAQEFAPEYLAYIRDTRWRELGWARARLRWLKYRVLWAARLQSRSNGNPLALS